MTDADHSTAKEIEEIEEPLDDELTDPSYEPPRMVDDNAESEDMFDEDEERGDDEDQEDRLLLLLLRGGNMSVIWRRILTYYKG